MMNRVLRAVAVAAAAVLLVGQPTSVMRDDARAAVPPAALPGTVSVQLAIPEGYVTPEGMSEPDLEGVYGEIWNDEDWYVVDSDAAGVLTFEDVEPGAYRLYVGTPQGGALVGGAWKQGVLDPDGGSESFTVGAAGLGLVAELAPAAVVRGTVLDAAGAPVEGAQLWGYAGESVTGPDGAFAFAAVPGTTTVWVEAPSGGALLSGYWAGNGAVASSDWDSASRVTVGDDLTVTPAHVEVRLPAGATVSGTILRHDGSPAVGAEVNVDGRTALTGADGTYTVGGLTPGYYQVEVDPANSYDVGGYVLADGGIGNWSDGDPLELEVGAEPITGIDGTLRLGGAVAGVLHDAAGDPIADMYVSAWSETGDGDRGAWTDESGRFTVEGMVPDEYSVVAQHYRYGFVQATGVTVTGGATADVGTLTLAAPRPVEVTVTDGSGAPVEGATVAMSGDDLSTDANGQVSTTVARAGWRSFEVYAPGFADYYGETEVLAEGVTHVDVVLSRAASLELTVLSAGEPVVDRRVGVRDPLGAVTSGYTDESGMVMFDSIATGTYRAVVAGTTDLWDSWHEANATSDEFEVAEGDNALSVDVNLSHAITVDVRGLDGEPLADTEVYLNTPGNEGITSAYADGDGRVVFDALLPGQYEVFTFISGYSYSSDWVELDHANPTASVTIAPDTSTLVRVTGLVVDEAGVPLEGERVEVRALDGEGGETDWATSDTDPDGIFSAWVRRDAQWEVIAAAGSDSLYLPSHASGSTPVDGDVTVTLTLEAGTEYSGTVLGGTAADPSGATESVPVEDAWVNVYYDGVYRQARTDQDGRYLLRGLPAELDATLSVSPQSPYLRDDFALADGQVVTLALGGTVTVPVSIPDGEAYGDVGFEHETDGGSWWGVWLTPEGTEITETFPAGEVTVTVAAEDHQPYTTTVTVVPGQDVRLDPVVLEPSQSGSVTGIVSAGGVPFAYAEVVALVGGVEILHESTAWDGSYRVRGIPSGTADIEVRWGGETVASATIEVDADQQQFLDIEADTALLGSVMRFALTGEFDDTARFNGDVTAVNDEFAWGNWSTDGRVQFVGLHAGPTGFQVSADERYAAGWISADGTVTREPVTFDIVPGETFADYHIALDTAAAAHGTVTVEGVPLMDADVELLVDGVVQETVITDRDGAWRVTSIDSGDADVRVSWKGDLIGSATGEALAGETLTLDVDAPVETIGSLVRFEVDGAYDDEAPFNGWIQTTDFKYSYGHDGRIQFVGLDSGDHHFWMGYDSRYVAGWIAPDGSVSTDEDSIAIESGVTATSLTVTPTPAATVDVTVTAGGLPLYGASLSLTDGDGTEEYGSTGVNGQARIGGLAPGDGTVEATWRGQTIAAETVTLAPGDSGAIVLEADTSIITSLLRFTLQTPDDGTYDGWVLVNDESHIRPQSNMVQVVNLAEGEHTFEIYGDESYGAGWIRPDGSVGAPEAFTVTSGETYAEYTVELEPAVHITGTVTDVHGAAIEGVTVSSGRSETWTDENGEYTLAGLGTGELDITASDGPWLYSDLSTVVNAPVAGETYTANLTMVRVGSLTVNVTDVEGDTVEGARLWAYPLSGGSHVYAESDARGAAHFEAVQDEPYEIYVMGPGTSDIDGFVTDDAGTPLQVHVAPGETAEVAHEISRFADVTVTLDVVDPAWTGERVTMRAMDLATGLHYGSRTVTVGTTSEVTFAQLRPGDYVITMSGGYYPNLVVGADGQGATAEDVEPIHLSGTGDAQQVTATLARNWVDSTTEVTPPTAPVEYGPGSRLTYGVTIPAGSLHSGLPVAITVDGEQVATRTVSGTGGTYTVTLPVLSVGEHTITVTTTAAGAVRGSADTLTLTVVPATPTLDVSAASSPRYGESLEVDLTAYYGSRIAIPGAVVDLTVGEHVYEVPLDGTSTTFTVPDALSVGEVALGATLRATDITTAADATGTAEVRRWDSTLTVETDQDSVRMGDPLSLTATPVTGGGNATGAVTVTAHGVELGSGEAGAPIAIDTSTLSPGEHTLTATYEGSSTVRGSTGTVLVTTTGFATAVSLTGPTGALVYGDDARLDVAVTSPQGAVSGDVRVRVGEWSSTVTLIDGAASVTVPGGLPAGSHHAVAEFLGSSAWLPSTSVTLEFDVVAAATAVDADWPSAGSYGSTSTVRASVATVLGYPVGGIVVLDVDGVEVDRQTLSDGSVRLTLPATVAVGEHSLRVRYLGTSDALASEESGPWTVQPGAPELEIAVTPTLVALSAATPPVEVAIAADAGGVPLTYRVYFGDGSAPVEGGMEADTVVSHLYDSPGSYGIRVEVRAGERVTVRTERVTVFTDAPLTAVAGDAQTTVAGDRVWFDAAGSRPAPAIDTVAWDFGDGTTGEGWQVSHRYAEAGNYTVTLTVSRGDQQAVATTTVSVAAVSLSGGVDVSVTTGGSALAGAQVVFTAPDGSKSTARTEADGVATLHGLPDGTASIAVWADGYTPQTITVAVTEGAGRVSVALEPGEIASTVLEHRRMTLDEIVDAGIDLEDPDNTNVYEADIMLHFVAAPGSGSGTPRYSVTYGTNTGGSSGSPWGAHLYDVRCVENCGGASFTATPNVTVVDGQPLIQWLVIPMQASWLKEMFEVQLVVTNLAPEDFVFTDGTAELLLPTGLSLATMVGEQQSLSTALADIPGGTSGTATWYVRGDGEGEHVVSARYDAVVDPVDVPISLTATAAEPIKVWGASALDTVITADPDAEWGAPYRVTLEVTNVTAGSADPATIHNLQIGLLERPADAPEEWALYQWAPEYKTWSFTAELAPGETATVDAILYPFIGHELSPLMLLDLGRSAVVQTGGNVDLEPRLETRAESTPRGDLTASLRTTAAGDRLDLAWDEVAGADGYWLYTRDSLRTGQDEWRRLATVGHDVHSATLRTSMAGLGRYVTVVAHRDGEPVAEAPLIEAPLIEAQPGD